MALPPRAAAVLVKLYDAPSATAKPQGILADFQTTGTGSPKQTDFYSNQWWYKDWPDEVIVKTHASGTGEVVVGISYVSPLAYESVYPDNIVLDYDPTSPYFDPVPNPNGTVGTYNGTYAATFPTFNFPRWHSETAYDLSAYYATWPGIVPAPGGVGGTDVGVGAFSNLNLFSGWSIDVSAANFQSEVFNRSTSAFEYYPFTQATTTYKQTCKFTVNIVSTDICCWNDGTIIRGKVAFKSLNAITTALDNAGSPGYGFGGINIVTGSTFASAGEADWEVTIEDGFVPTEIEIPKVAGSFTFINDFWVTEVVKPT